MKKEKIGEVEITYSEAGIVHRASFVPTLITEFTGDVISQLGQLKSAKDSETIVFNAEMILAAWFSKLNDLELRDPEVTQIIGEVKQCNHYANGMVQSCQMNYYAQTV